MAFSSSRRTFLTALSGSAALAGAAAGAETIDGIVRHGRFCVIASEAGAKLDSNVETGGGTDETELFQKILDLAVVWGGLHLIVDGAALVRCLAVHSNTTIECPNAACGFFHKGNDNAPLLRNADYSMTERPNKNITLLGGTYNGNCLEQAHDYPASEADYDYKPELKVFGDVHWNFIFEFFGVEDFTARGVTFRDQPTFTMLMTNFQRVLFEDTKIDLPHRLDCKNQDGLHFWGPGRFLTIRNLQGDSGDDIIALAPDENDHVSDITDVLIDGVQLQEAFQGIRLLSRDKGRLDRVIIKNVTGTYENFGFYIVPWFTHAGGNLGNITIDTVDIRGSNPHAWFTPFVFSAAGSIESLVLRNVTHHAPDDDRILFQFGSKYGDELKDENGQVVKMKIDTILIDGLRVYHPRFSEEHPTLINVGCDVRRLTVRNAEV
ncbi:MAG: hypothetical protein J6S75_00260, partial [Thermoguttaceae bacterium]|nr:hypothetical protein [Thermoguttaceae bacterium]